MQGSSIPDIDDDATEMCKSAARVADTHGATTFVGAVADFMMLVRGLAVRDSHTRSVNKNMNSCMSSLWVWPSTVFRG